MSVLTAKTVEELGPIFTELKFTITRADGRFYYDGPYNQCLQTDPPSTITTDDFENLDFDWDCHRTCLIQMSAGDYQFMSMTDLNDLAMQVPDYDEKQELLVDEIHGIISEDGEIQFPANNNADAAPDNTAMEHNVLVTLFQYDKGSLDKGKAWTGRVKLLSKFAFDSRMYCPPALVNSDGDGFATGTFPPDFDRASEVDARELAIATRRAELQNFRFSFGDKEVTTEGYPLFYKYWFQRNDPEKTGIFLLDAHMRDRGIPPEFDMPADSFLRITLEMMSDLPTSQNIAQDGNQEELGKGTHEVSNALPDIGCTMCGSSEYKVMT